VRRRFFVEQFAGDRAVMAGEAAHHLARVLRAQAGQVYELSDGSRVRLARVESVGRERVEFALLEELPAYQPSLHVTLLLSVVKFDAFEWAIEKATELGVSRIVPLAAGRSEKKLLAAAAKRAGRWKKILLEASQQSRRVQLPILEDLARAEDAFASHNDGLRVLLSERASAAPLRKILEGQQTANAKLAIGPEGGWTDSEFAAAQRHGYLEASLGRLILRTETAVLAALASLEYALSRE
jgi:16S rRNA (uracil1498-N3)-methyltransferase